MNTRLVSFLACVLTLGFSPVLQGQVSLLAGFDFNNLDEESSTYILGEYVQKLISNYSDITGDGQAAGGRATFYFDGTNGSDSWNGDYADEVYGVFGTTTNQVINTTIRNDITSNYYQVPMGSQGGSTLGLGFTPGEGRSKFSFGFETLGYSNLEFSFAGFGGGSTPTGTVSWSYFVGVGGSLKETNITSEINAAMTPFTVDLSGFPEIGNKELVTVVGSISGFPESIFSFDNLQIIGEVATASAPEITSPATASGIAGQPFSYQIAASNDPTSFGATGLAAGLEVNMTSGLISGTPAGAGVTVVTVLATNGDGTGEASVTVTIAEAAPVISSPTTATGTVGVAFTYTITTTGGTPTSFGATPLPTGLSIASGTGVISGTPTAVVQTSVTLSANNASGTDEETLTLTINPPAPVINSPETAAGNVGSPFSYQITATNEPTAFEVSDLPSWASINNETGLISGTPDATGETEVTVGATNAGGIGTAVVTVTIGSATPVITSAETASGFLGQTFSYQITASGAPTAFGASGLPAGLTVDTATGLISGTPSVEGDFVVTLTAINQGGTGEGAVTLTVVGQPVVTSLPETGGVVGAAFAYQIVATNQPTAYGASDLPDGLSVDTATGLISGNPASIGTTEATFSVENPAGVTVAALLIVVTGGEPVIVSPSTASGVVGTAFSYQIVADNGATSYTATGLPAGLALDEATGLISGTPTAAGVSEVVLGGLNESGTGSKDLTLTVTQALPVITSPTTAEGTVGLPFSYQITASGEPTSFEAVGLPDWASLDGDSGIISGFPDADGETEVTIKAINAAGTAEATLTLTIAPPVFDGVYFGDICETCPGDEFGIFIREDGTGVFMAFIPDAGVGFIYNALVVDESGSFSFETTAKPLAGGAAGSESAEGVMAAAETVVTVTGDVTFDAVSFEISPLNVSSQADRVFDTGPTEAAQGLYEAAVLETTGSTTTIIAGADGTVFLMAESFDGVDGGSGLINTGGAVEVMTVGGFDFALSVSANGEVSGTATSPDGESKPVVGLADGQVQNIRLLNVSTRGSVDGTNTTLIGGFVISGTASKPVLIRGIGPGLGTFGVNGFVENPRLRLFPAATQAVPKPDPIVVNDKWGDASNAAEIKAAMARVGAFALPDDSLDAVILVTLEPGVYSAVMSGIDGSPGIGLMEAYDATEGEIEVAFPRMANLSTRGVVQPGAGSLIAGFVIQGEVSKTILVRGIGPELGEFGVSNTVPNPRLRLFPAATTEVPKPDPIRENNGWDEDGNGPAIAAAAASVGGFGLTPGGGDTSILITLPPGVYSAVLSDVNGESGAGLIEIYEVTE